MTDASTPQEQGPDTVPAAELSRVLSEVQRRGGIGRGGVDAEITHARQYAAALPSPTGSLVDLGSGGGLPGLVIAAHAPGWSVTLIERRSKRADLLRYGAQALGLAARVQVLTEDVDVAVRWPELAEQHDVVTARSFASPLVVLRVAPGFLHREGWVLISDPPDGAPRWTDAELHSLAFTDEGRVGGIRRFHRLPLQA